MQSENTKGFHIAILTIVFLAAFILNFVSYGKMGNKQYINRYLHIGLFVFYFIFGIGIQLLSPVSNYMKGSFDTDFHSSAIVNTIPKLIFLGALLYTGIIESTTGPALAKTVKDEMGQDVTQEKVLLESYGDYFTFKLLADIFLFIMFLFITVWAFANQKIIDVIYENREAIHNWGVYVGFGVFTVLHFVFQGLRHDILKNFLTDGFQLMPKKLLNFLK
jgi:hypothetical protein